MLKYFALSVGMLINLFLPATSVMLFFATNIPDGLEGDRSYGYATFLVPFTYVIFSVIPLLIYFHLSEPYKISLINLTKKLLKLACIPAIFVGLLVLKFGKPSELLEVVPLTFFSVLYVTIPGTIAHRLIYRKKPEGAAA